MKRGVCGSLCNECGEVGWEWGRRGEKEKFRYRKFTIERISSSGIHFRPRLPAAAAAHGLYTSTRVWRTFPTPTNHHRPTLTFSPSAAVVHTYTIIRGKSCARLLCYLFGSINLCSAATPRGTLGPSPPLLSARHDDW